ncbi:MAG: diaminopimelate decarboxylase [Candidatus Binatia bacterium]|nr:MAG: diaminopimelate decarboxylase [Candidatus Binatia bacterium]
MEGDRAEKRVLLERLAREFGTPAYVYFLGDIRRRAERLRTAFRGLFRLSYAVKSNPNRELLRRMREVVDLLDVSSAGEIRRAVRAGWPPGSTTFTGPAKTRDELRFAVRSRAGEVVLESLDEARLLEAICEQEGETQDVLLRIAPRHVPRGFGVNMSGKPTQFGVDEEELEDTLPALASLPRLRLRGFHIYSGTQCLKAEAVVENYRIFLDVFRRAATIAGLRPRRLVFGSGLGIPYHDADTALDLDAVASRTVPELERAREEPSFREAEFVLETGRYLVGEAGIYLTRVVRTKRSRGVTIALCDGGMNHHLGAAGHLGSILQRNYRMFKVTPDRGEESEYTLVGPLCTTIDTIGRNVRFRGLETGDVVAVECSGAYGLTASPIHFISHPPPREILVDEAEGTVRLEDVGEFSAEPGEA